MKYECMSAACLSILLLYACLLLLCIDEYAWKLHGMRSGFPIGEKYATVFPNEMIENDNRSDSSSQKSKEKDSMYSCQY